MARKFQFQSYSVVIIANNHNPSLLNPDFLHMNSIVPAELTPLKALTTPAISSVDYEGVTIQVEMQKLQITTQNEKNCRLINRVVTNLLKTLPHVPYKAIGLNWGGHAVKDEPSPWLIKRFIKTGKWTSEEYALQHMELKFSFQLSNAMCNLTLSDIMVSIDDTLTPAVSVYANYHHEIADSDNPVKGAVGIIRQYSRRRDHLSTVLKDTLQLAY